MLIDSHCHLDDYEDLDAILAHAREAGVGKLLAIGIGDGPDTMHRALELAHAHPQISPPPASIPRKRTRLPPRILPSSKPSPPTHAASPSARSASTTTTSTTPTSPPSRPPSLRR